jgi:hypothetical protein
MAKKEIAREVVSNTAEVMDKIIETVGPAIKSLASSLGTSAEQIMVILTRQAVTDGIGSLISFAICFGIAYGCYRGMRLAWEHKQMLDEGIMPIYLFGVIGFGVGVGFGLTELISGIKHIINPQYYALHEVMDFIQKFRSK